MDLGAYAQIDNLEQIMKDNGIEVPRLRGLRLMKNEKPVSKEELLDMAKSDRLYRKKVFRQFDMWNKYCGIDDVLYIHARLGSGNWGDYDCDKVVKSQPWFLDYVEDYFDCTYVDIYAKIKTPEM